MTITPLSRCLLAAGLAALAPITDASAQIDLNTVPCMTINGLSNPYDIRSSLPLAIEPAATHLREMRGQPAIPEHIIDARRELIDTVVVNCRVRPDMTAGMHVESLLSEMQEGAEEAVVNSILGPSTSAGLATAPTPPAPPPPPEPSAGAAELGPEAIAAIVDASQNNEVRFNRDHRGKRVMGSGLFQGVTENLMISGLFDAEISLGNETVLCESADRSQIAAWADLQPGSAVRFEGRIETTIFGQLVLENGCRMTRQP